MHRSRDSMGEDTRWSTGNDANNAKVISNNPRTVNSLSIIRGASTFVIANTIITAEKIVCDIRD